jgi:hypothetical protein
MNNIIIATLIGLSIVGTGAISANAGPFSVHGYSTHYGR